MNTTTSPTRSHLETLVLGLHVEFSVTSPKTDETLSFQVEQAIGRQVWYVRVSRGAGFRFAGVVRIGLDNEVYFMWVAQSTLPANHPAVVASEWVFTHLAELDGVAVVEEMFETGEIAKTERRAHYVGKVA